MRGHPWWFGGRHAYIRKVLGWPLGDASDGEWQVTVYVQTVARAWKSVIAGSHSNKCNGTADDLPDGSCGPTFRLVRSTCRILTYDIR